MKKSGANIHISVIVILLLFAVVLVCFSLPSVAVSAKAAESNATMEFVETASAVTTATAAAAFASEKTMDSDSITPRWVKKGNKKVAYIKSNGEYAKGPFKIGKKLYLFSEGGRLATQKSERKVEYKGSYYDVRKDGSLRKGWQVFSNKLYYFGGKNAAMVRSKIVKRIRLRKDGTAIMTLDAATRIKSIKILKLLKVRDKSKQKQLRAAFLYVTKMKYIKMNNRVPRKSSKWVKKYASQMLTTKRGNCFRFACAFAALAYEIGYEPRVAVGRIQEAHSVVIIKNRYYDLTFYRSYRHSPTVEKYYAHKNGIQYNYYSYTKHYSRKYSACDGTARTGKYDYRISKKEKRIKSELMKKKGKVYYYNSKGKRTIPKNKVIYYNDRYYCFNKKGVSPKGIYYKSGHLYKQNVSCDKYGYYMTETDYKALQKKIKEGQSYEELVEIIGPGTAGELTSSCYGTEDGYDRIYKYPNFNVSVFCTEDGDDEIITGLF